MSEIIKFTEEEISEVKQLQQNYAQLTQVLGQIEFQKIIIENQRKQVIDKHGEIQKQEQDLIKKLTEKYGDGTLSLETGEFTPAPRQAANPDGLVSATTP